MLGMKRANIRLNHLDEAQRRPPLVIADNKIAENAGWDESLLREELSGAGRFGYNMNGLCWSSVDDVA